MSPLGLIGVLIGARAQCFLDALHSHAPSKKIPNPLIASGKEELELREGRFEAHGHSAASLFIMVVVGPHVALLTAVPCFPHQA